MASVAAVQISALWQTLLSMQVVESQKHMQPQSVTHSMEELSDMPVKELKSMLQTRNISYAGSLATSYAVALLPWPDMPYKGCPRKVKDDVSFGE